MQTAVALPARAVKNRPVTRRSPAVSCLVANLSHVREPRHWRVPLGSLRSIHGAGRPRRFSQRAPKGSRLVALERSVLLHDYLGHSCHMPHTSNATAGAVRQGPPFATNLRSVACIQLGLDPECPRVVSQLLCFRVLASRQSCPGGRGHGLSHEGKRPLHTRWMRGL
jgi:hypothetical protein